jgi:potassium-transporting ATPase KdpC subunit
MNTETSPLDHGGHLRAALGLALVCALVMGFAYSLTGTGLGRVLFPHAASGSLIQRDGRVIGSALVPQPFPADRYFQARPSGSNYDPMTAAGSNQARSNPDLRKRISEARAAVAARERIAPAAVPIELITQSGGGLDPHITPQGARVQAARVARARGLTSTQVEALIAAHMEHPQFGLLGQVRVNVLELNLALDALK